MAGSRCPAGPPKPARPSERGGEPGTFSLWKGRRKGSALRTRPAALLVYKLYRTQLRCGGPTPDTAALETPQAAPRARPGCSLPERLRAPDARAGAGRGVPSPCGPSAPRSPRPPSGSRPAAHAGAPTSGPHRGQRIRHYFSSPRKRSHPGGRPTFARLPLPAGKRGGGPAGSREMTGAQCESLRVFGGPEGAACGVWLAARGSRLAGRAMPCVRPQPARPGRDTASGCVCMCVCVRGAPWLGAGDRWGRVGSVQEEGGGGGGHERGASSPAGRGGACRRERSALSCPWAGAPRGIPKRCAPSCWHARQPPWKPEARN